MIKGIVYTKFDEKEGPISYIWEPEHLSLELRQMIILKSTGILAGEKGAVPKSLAILPIPSQDLKILIKIIKIEDESFRGGVNDASLTLIYREEFDSIFYKYMTNLEQLFEDVAIQIKTLEEEKSEKEVISKEISNFLARLKEKFNELKSEELKKEEELALLEAEKEIPKETKLKFKIVVCGDPAVGKTSTVLQYTDKAFRRKYIPTIGVNISTRKILFKNYLIEFILWDVAGQVRFQKMRKFFYEGANAQIIIFDLTRQETFDSTEDWHSDVKEHVSKDIPTVIIGNKNDLESEIGNEELKNVAEKLNCECFVTSALTGENIEETFNYLAEKLIRYHLNQ